MKRWLLAGCLLAPVAAHAASTDASSEWEDDEGVEHAAELAFDGLLTTAWSEGDEGPGAGSWIELDLGRPTAIESVSIWPGDLSNGDRSLKEQSRPKRITVELLGTDEETTRQVLLDDVGQEGPQRVDVRIEGQATGVRVTLDEVYEGVFANAHVAEIAVNFGRGEAPDAVGRVGAWHEGASGQRAAERAKEEVVALYEAAMAEDESSREALAELVDRAGDGPLYLRDRVHREVPAGFRVHALPPELVSVEALLKIKDPTGIPGVSLAALRSTGKEGRKLELQAQYFRAHQELVGGPGPQVPWGDTGWGEGLLQGFGEPMGIDVDVEGRIYVADIGNHRVQRFGPEGRLDRVWGSEPAIANAWFDGTREYHVAGSAPEEKAGRFVNPLDVAVIPGKEGDGFAVLDAKKRVQLFDMQGNLLIEWGLRTDETILPGVGGQAYIGVSKGKIVAVWGGEGFVFDPSGEELARFELEDGAPSGMVVLKNGKLGLVYGQELVMYSLDGFRHGSILGDEVGEGFENWDAALDQDGRLWVVTDKGRVIKYKKPGKVDYQVRFTDRSLRGFRIAVRDDVVYVLEGDSVEPVDALEIHTREELAREQQ